MKKILFIILAGSVSFSSYSQSITANTILNEDINQAGKLIEAYFTPMTKSFGLGLNNGWYNTAKPHSLGGFDLTITLNTVIIPNSAKTFNIQDAGGNIFVSNETEASTIFGNNDGTEMTYYPGGNGGMINPQFGFIGGEFNMPGGFNTSIVPIPIIQAGVGLVKKTDLSVRYMPMLNIGNNINVNVFGIGLRHDLLQWIPIVGDAFPMSLALQGGYTNLNTEVKVSGQKTSLNTKATTINLIASRKILMVTGYAGIGYNSTSTTFTSDAKFDLGGLEFDEKLSIDFESNNKFRANLGVRFNITLLTIQADYTIAEYPTATLGLGVSLR